MMRAGLILLVACAAAAAQPSPVFQTESKLVLVEAIATDKKGEPVRDLNAKDFRVWEDNKEQTIRSFSLETRAASGEPHRLILFFDSTNMDPADQARIREAAGKFIDANSSANRLTAVVTFDGNFHVAQNFTGNVDRLKTAIRSVNIVTPGALSGVNSRAGLPQNLASTFGLMQSLGNLASHLDIVPGRKILILFTAPPPTLTQTGDSAALVQSFNRSDVAVYPVLRAAASAPSPDGLDCGQRVGSRRTEPTQPCDLPDNSGVYYTLAAKTGGFAVTPTDDVISGLEKIGAEQDQYYVIGYTPPDSKPESCHTIRVKVDRPGVGLRVRSNYCSAKPQDLLAESRVEQDLEKEAAGPVAGSAPASIQAPFFYIAPNVARVHAVMEFPANAFQSDNEKGKLHSEMNVLGIVRTADGMIAARFSDVVKRNFNNQQEASAFKGNVVAYEKDFKVSSGQYTLTVVFRSGTSSGKVETPLTVGVYEQGKLAVSGVAFGKQVRPAANLGLEASLTGGSTPLIASGMEIIPSGSNQFQRSDQAFCYFEVYPPAASVHVRVLTNNSRPAWDGGEAKVSPATGGNFIPVGLNVPIASLSSGSYELEVTAMDAGGNTVKQTAPFTIE